MLWLLDVLLWLAVGAGAAWLMWQYRHRIHLPNLGGLGKVDHYHGLFYFDPDDRRLLVPERWGGGFTLNIAHRFSGAVLVLMFGLPLGSMIVIAALR
jgi:uncharacterized membrane protein